LSDLWKDVARRAVIGAAMTKQERYWLAASATTDKRRQITQSRLRAMHKVMLEL
jgi:hypothetical protein